MYTKTIYVYNGLESDYLHYSSYIPKISISISTRTTDIKVGNIL